MRSQEARVPSGCAKKMVAKAAMDYVNVGMRLGLGTGSTANEFAVLLAAAVKEGLEISCVPTSKATAKIAANHGIPLTTLDETPELDLTIDGADEIGPDLALIKGGGGAHLCEKIVAQASKRLIIIADNSKYVDKLGAFGVPIEVVPFGLAATHKALLQTFEEEGLDCVLTLRGGREMPFTTDCGNVILDAKPGLIDKPDRLAERLSRVPGVVEHGLFVGLASMCLIAGPDGLISLSNPA